MQIPRAGRKQRERAAIHRGGRGCRTPGRRGPELLERAVGVQWYRQARNRRRPAPRSALQAPPARAGVRGGPEPATTRCAAPLEVSPEAVVWLASRAISYMDETGFPEAVEPWFRETYPPELSIGRRLSGRGARAAARTGRARRPARYGARATSARSPSHDGRPAPEELVPCGPRPRAGSPSTRCPRSRRRADRASRAPTGPRVPRLGCAAREDPLASFQNWTKTGSIPGPARTAREPAFATGWLSPSVSTTQPLVRAGRRSAVPRGQRARARDARGSGPTAGGGRSIPTERSIVASNTFSSRLGKRCGSTRSVSDATPTGTRKVARRRSRSLFARSMRSAEPGRCASIERETCRGRRNLRVGPHPACSRAGRQAVPQQARRGTLAQPRATSATSSGRAG